MIKEQSNTTAMGWLKIVDRNTQEVVLDKKNAIHYENLAVALAKALARDPDGFIYSMHFGNGGSVVSGTGAISYFPPRVTGDDANLYNETYYKVVDDKSPFNTDPSTNNVSVAHVKNTVYADVIINCTLEYSEPAGQQAFDDAQNAEGSYIFDEIAIKVFGTDGPGNLITHVIFNPIQKSLNRALDIEYTIRISMC